MGVTITPDAGTEPPFNVLLSPEASEALAAIAAREGVPMAVLCRKFIADGIRRQAQGRG